MYFLKELLLLGKEKLANEIRYLLFTKVIDRLCIKGFNSDEKKEIVWAIILTGKILDIMEDDIISQGIIDRVFGNYDMNSQNLDKIKYCSKWLTVFQKSDDIGLLVAISYLLYAMVLRGLLSEYTQNETSSLYLNSLLQKIFNNLAVPAIVLMGVFQISSTGIKLTANFNVEVII